MTDPITSTPTDRLVSHLSEMERLVLADALVRSIESADLHLAISAHAHFSRRKAVELSEILSPLTEQDDVPQDAAVTGLAGPLSSSLRSGKPKNCSPRLKARRPHCLVGAERATAGPVLPQGQGRAFGSNAGWWFELLGDFAGALALFFLLFLGLWAGAMFG